MSATSDSHMSDGRGSSNVFQVSKGICENVLPLFLFEGGLTHDRIVSTCEEVVEVTFGASSQSALAALVRSCTRCESNNLEAEWGSRGHRGVQNALY